MSGHIKLILGITVRCIESGGCQHFPGTGPVRIGKPCLVLAVSDLAHPAAQIALVDPIVMLHACVDNIMNPDIGVVVGYVKISLVPKILTPAVGTDKRPVPLQVHIKILPGIIVIPSNNHGIMVRLFAAHITVGIGFPVIVHGLALVIPHGGIQRTLHPSFQVYGPFNGIIILGLQDLDLLHMLPGH